MFGRGAARSSARPHFSEWRDAVGRRFRRRCLGLAGRYSAGFGTSRFGSLNQRLSDTTLRSVDLRCRPCRGRAGEAA